MTIGNAHRARQLRPDRSPGGPAVGRADAALALHFAISTEKMPWALMRALLIVKRSAARVNAALGTLAAPTAEAIVAAADEALAGRTTASSRWPSGRPARARRPT